MMDIREKLDIEFTPEERERKKLIEDFFQALALKGVGAIIIYGTQHPVTLDVSASVQLSPTLTKEGIVTFMTALNNYMTTKLEES